MSIEKFQKATDDYCGNPSTENYARLVSEGWQSMRSNEGDVREDDYEDFLELDGLLDGIVSEKTAPFLDDGSEDDESLLCMGYVSTEVLGIDRRRLVASGLADGSALAMVELPSLDPDSMQNTAERIFGRNGTEAGLLVYHDAKKVYVFEAGRKSGDFADFRNGQLLTAVTFARLRKIMKKSTLPCAVFTLWRGDPGENGMYMCTEDTPDGH